MINIQKLIEEANENGYQGATACGTNSLENKSYAAG